MYMRERKITFAGLRFQRRIKEEDERERERERRFHVCVYVLEREILNVKLTIVLLKLLMRVAHGWSHSWTP